MIEAAAASINEATIELLLNGYYVYMHIKLGDKQVVPEPFPEATRPAVLLLSA